MKRLLKFVRLPAAEQRLLLKAALLLGATRLGLWILPFHTLRHLLAKVMEPCAGLQQGPTQSSAKKVVWAVETASRYAPGARTCLTRALAVQVLLTRRGHPALLHIGVEKGAESRLQAHAWIENQGEILIGGSELERYTPLVTLTGRTS